MNKYSKYIYKKIKEYETIVITRHLNSDMDALGAQFALKEWIKLNFPNKKVYCIGENHQKYTKNFIPKSDAFNSEIRYLGICVDVNSIERMDGGDIFKDAECKICIDHHEYIDNNEFNFVCVNKKIIACCQLLAQILFNMKKKMNTIVCKYLYAGICSDSGNFYYSNTDYVTLEVASKLIKIGKFDPYKDIHMLVGMKSFRDLEIAHYLFSKLTLDTNGFGCFINSKEDLKNLNLTASGANEKISEFNRVEEIKIFLAASQCDDDTYRCSIRSKEKDVAIVARKYGGGGHKLACGVKNLTLEQLEMLKKDLLNLL